MQFFKTVRSSVYDPEFYRSMKEKKSSSALGYFTLIILIVSLALSVQPVYNVASFIFQPSEDKTALREAFLSFYPDELVLRTGNGELSMNMESPYVIPIPEGMEGTSYEEDATNYMGEYQRNLLVIDTEKPIDVEDFYTYNTNIILSADSIGILDEEKGKIQIQDLRGAFETPFTVDKAQYTEWIGALEKFLMGFGVVLLFLIPVFLFFGLAIGNALYLLFGALVVWLAAKIRGADWGYGTSYKAGLYLLTVPLLYSTLTSFSVVPDVSFLFTVILLFMTLVNTGKEKVVAAPVIASETVPTDTSTSDTTTSPETTPYKTPANDAPASPQTDTPKTT